MYFQLNTSIFHTKIRACGADFLDVDFNNKCLPWKDQKTTKTKSPKFFCPPRGFWIRCLQARLGSEIFCSIKLKVSTLRGSNLAVSTLFNLPDLTVGFLIQLAIDSRLFVFYGRKRAIELSVFDSHQGPKNFALEKVFNKKVLTKNKSKIFFKSFKKFKKHKKVKNNILMSVLGAKPKVEP